MVLALPFFSIDLSHAYWVTAAVAVAVAAAVGSLSLVGLGILTGVLPLLYPERGEQMAFMAQAGILLISGAYYSVDTLPAWLRFASHLSPATNLLRGVRNALINGATLGSEAGEVAVLAIFAFVLLPCSIVVFSAAERWAKKTGRLKRQG